MESSSTHAQAGKSRAKEDHFAEPSSIFNEENALWIAHYCIVPVTVDATLQGDTIRDDEGKTWVKE
jgi:hypothetical protein